jgi:hypothetical protein
MDTIRFCRLRDEFGCFSNFAPYGFELDGYFFKTSEHAYQAQKFAVGGDYFMSIFRAKTPREAADLGRSSAVEPMRADWEEVKLDVMYKCLKAKFTQNPDLKDILLSTGESRIVEEATAHKDYFWGEVNGEGSNHLGNLLMRLRKELRKP